MKNNFRLTKNENIKLMVETVAFVMFVVTLIFVYISFDTY